MRIEQRSSDFILDEQNVDCLFVQIDIVFIKNGVLENRRSLSLTQDFRVLLEPPEQNVVGLVDVVIIRNKFDKFLVKFERNSVWMLLQAFELLIAKLIVEVKDNRQVREIDHGCLDTYALIGVFHLNVLSKVAQEIVHKSIGLSSPILTH